MKKDTACENMVEDSEPKICNSKFENTLKDKVMNSNVNELSTILLRNNKLKQHLIFREKNLTFKVCFSKQHAFNWLKAFLVLDI